jgi:hypothetical protein
MWCRGGVALAAVGSLLALRVLGAQSGVAANVAGDSSSVARINAATRVIYDSSGNKVYSLVRGNPLGLPTADAAEIEGSFLGGRISRIVAFSWTSSGKYATELYFQRDSLIFVYEDFAYLPGQAPPGQWQNFKKLPVWEARSYWHGDSILFIEARGRSASYPPSEVAALRRRARTLRRIVEDRARELRAR